MATEQDPHALKYGELPPREPPTVEQSLNDFADIGMQGCLKSGCANGCIPLPCFVFVMIGVITLLTAGILTAGFLQK